MNLINGKINYVGWLGHGNLGDEALYKVDQALLGEYQLVPEWFETFSRQHSQITFIGGGTCVPDIARYVKPTRYNYMFGVGVEDPEYYGPFKPFLVKRLRDFDFRYFGVRSSTSKAILDGWGIESEVIGDPVLSLSLDCQKMVDEKRVGINIGSSLRMLWGSEEKVAKELVLVLRTLRREGYSFKLFPFWVKDLPYLDRFSSKENISISEDWSDISSTLSGISSCRIFVGMKLHSLVLSAAAYTPFICLGYAPECLEFADSVGFSDYAIPTNEVTSERVLDLFHDLVDNYSMMREKLITKVNFYRSRQKDFANRIKADIESLPRDKWHVPYKGRIGDLLWRMDSLLKENAATMWQIWNQLFFSRSMRYLS